MEATAQVFSIELMHHLVIAGCADGNMLVYDTNNGECLYGYGVMKKGEVKEI